MARDRRDRRDDEPEEGEHGGLLDGIIPESAKRAAERADVMSAKLRKAVDAFCKAWLEG